MMSYRSLLAIPEIRSRILVEALAGRINVDEQIDLGRVVNDIYATLTESERKEISFQFLDFDESAEIRRVGEHDFQRSRFVILFPLILGDESVKGNRPSEMVYFVDKLNLGLESLFSERNPKSKHLAARASSAAIIIGRILDMGMASRIWNACLVDEEFPANESPQNGSPSFRSCSWLGYLADSFSLGTEPVR